MFEVIAIMTIVALVFVILILMMHISRLRMRLDMTKMKASDPSTECVCGDACECGHVLGQADIDGGRCTSCLTMLAWKPSTECACGAICVCGARHGDDCTCEVCKARSSTECVCKGDGACTCKSTVE